jgi:tetratricopeptide (TPR) repeat protein
MKKITVSAILIYIVFALTACATSGTTAAGTVSLDQAIADCAEKLKATVSGKTEIVIAAISAPDDKTADFLTAELSAKLLRSGSFTVLERGNALKAVDAEQEFQMSGLVSDDSAVGIGHYLGAKVVVTGTFEPYNGFSQLRLRAVDVRTSQILAMPSSRINPKDRILAGVMPQNIKPQNIKVESIDHLARGKDLYREKKYDEAIAEYDEAIRLDPKNAEAYLQRGIAYSGKGDEDRAFAEYNLAIQINPNYAEAFHYRGIIYQGKGDNALAIADYTQAIRINPNLLYAYFLRGMIREGNKDFDLAIADYTHCIRIDPNGAL